MIPIALLLSARDHIYVVLKNPSADQLRYGHNLDVINNSIHLGFSVLCAIVVLQLAWEIGRTVWHAYRRREATSSDSLLLSLRCCSTVRAPLETGPTLADEGARIGGNMRRLITYFNSLLLGMILGMIFVAITPRRRLQPCTLKME